jgi:hypothetical protein
VGHLRQIHRTPDSGRIWQSIAIAIIIIGDVIALVRRRPAMLRLERGGEVVALPEGVG